MRITTNAIAVLTCLILGIAVLNAAPPTGMEAPDPETAARMMSRFQEMAKKSEVPISFYGRVIDQDDRPVDGAEIKIHIQYYDPTKPDNYFQATKRIIVNTDKNGRFAVENERGSLLGPETISKNGFEFAFSSNRNRSFNFDRSHGKPHLPDKTKPVLFHLRKKGPATFLLECRDLAPRIVVRPDGNAVIGEISNDRNYYWPDNSKQFPGFSVSGALSKDSRDWVLTFKGKHADDRVLLLDHIIYEAPEQGYKPSAEMKLSLEKNPVPGRGPTYPHRTEAYLIVRTAKPETFTRVFLEVCPREEENCDINYKITLNPYGEKSFEWAVELDKYYEVWKSLEAPAIHALCNGQLPPKPDITKLIQEAKEKAAKKSDAKQ